MRLDIYLVEKGIFPTRTKAKEAVERGEVLVGGKAVKPSHDVGESDAITVAEAAAAYVSNGAFKLLKAFETFDFSVDGKTVLDIGASTGGFTQVALLKGAKKVFAIDVGEGLLCKSLASDKRVCMLENTNARFITPDMFSEKIEAVVSDVSFISLTYILPVISRLLSDGCQCVLLIKPQFECGKAALSKNGIVLSPKNRIDACEKVISAAESLGLGAVGLVAAPIRDGKNREYLLHLIKGHARKISSDVEKLVCNE